MAWKRKIKGGITAVVGYMLSPLSRWNDLFVNIPLALAFAWVVSLCYRPAFQAAVITGYWLTNIVGLILMHKGAEQILSEKEKKYSLRHFARDLAILLALHRPDPPPLEARSPQAD